MAFLIDRWAGGGSLWLSVALAALGLQACSPGGGKAAAQASPRTVCLNTLDPAQGIDACKAAIADSPDDPQPRLRMALLRLKSGSLTAARQAYQIARSEDQQNSEAQFGLGLTLETIGEPGANLQKVEAARRDPSVIDRFRKYGFSDLDLMTFDTAAKIISVPSDVRIKALIPKLTLAKDLGVDVKCQVAVNGRLHDCNVVTPLTEAQAPFGEAAKRILMLSKVRSARDMGAPVADAPVVLTMRFDKTT